MKENPYSDATNEKDPMDDFIRTLRREPIEVNEAMQKGINLENMVTAILHGQGDASHNWHDAANEIATAIRGAQLQFKANRTIQIDDRDVFLYGRLDALKAGIIYDIKYSGSYESGRFIDSTQHPMYFKIMPNAYGFTYLTSNGQNVWSEHYRREESPDIIPTIRQFYAWLDAQGLTQIYTDNWEAKS